MSGPVSAKYTELLVEALLSDDQHPILMELAMNWHEALYGVPVGPALPRTRPMRWLRALIGESEGKVPGQG